ncbi:hypothetical protein BDW69DRAFT_70525 [Aspergillus filifer]
MTKTQIQEFSCGQSFASLFRFWLCGVQVLWLYTAMNPRHVPCCLLFSVNIYHLRAFRLAGIRNISSFALLLLCVHGALHSVYW